MWKDRNDIENVVNDVKYQYELKKFIKWSFDRQCRILQDISHITEETPVALRGSGGYLIYKDRHFLVTNEHVVHDIEMEKVIAICGKSTSERAILVKEAKDPNSDIAVYEVDPSCINKFCNHTFLTISRVNQDPIRHLQEFNTVYLNAVPSARAELDYDKKTLDLENYAYCGFVLCADDYGLIEIAVSDIAYDENKSINGKVLKFNGMSGSWVYGYHPELRHKFKCIGILTGGNPEAKRAWVIRIDKVLEFIDSSYFVK